MRTAKVSVVPYDAAWVSAFEKIKNEISLALGELAVGIEHVGSTSVEGMSAKPCIDIDVIIRDRSLLGEVVMRLGAIGYIHEGDLGIEGREAFAYSDKPHLYRHHLYVCAQGCAELRRHVAFRDHLRADPNGVREYSRIKEDGALMYPDNIDKYIAHKAPCISALYVKYGIK